MAGQMQPLGLLRTVHQTILHEGVPVEPGFCANGKWLSPSPGRTYPTGWSALAQEPNQASSCGTI
jgi:hypothetical protein